MNRISLVYISLNYSFYVGSSFYNQNEVRVNGRRDNLTQTYQERVQHVWCF